MNYSYDSSVVLLSFKINLNLNSVPLLEEEISRCYSLSLNILIKWFVISKDNLISFLSVIDFF